MAYAILAGMRVVVLTDLARFRLQTLSFFLLTILILAVIVQLLWNYLRRDFGALPRLTYGKSVGVVCLWGLLFIIVLAMISGARELMTPGAWVKQSDGGYKLADNATSVSDDAASRIEKLRQSQPTTDTLSRSAK